MVTNPLDIQPGTVFIVGPRKLAYIFNFYKLDNRLSYLQYKVFNPALRKKECHHINLLVAYMAMCDIVVTLSDWELDPECMQLVQIARHMNKEIHPEDKYYVVHRYHSER